MKFQNKSKFHIHGLNQEKILNEISKKHTLCDVCRTTKQETTFTCEYVEHKKVEKMLKDKNVQIEKIEHQGFLHKIHTFFTNFGLIFAVFLFLTFFLIQNQFVVQYEIVGTQTLNKLEVVNFVKQNFPKSKHKINTKNIEVGLRENFDCISFVSCAIEGQTLIVNIKEKLLPNEMAGEFSPIIAKKDAKISKIDLISGTLMVKVGDFVQKGDVLVEPYVEDSSGQIKAVEAKANIWGQIFNTATEDHYEKYIKVERTGRKVVQNNIKLFGLTIYSLKEENNFKMFEVETKDIDLAKNLFLPFKMQKTTIFELEENVVETKFEDMKDEIVEKARQKALRNVENCDKIVDEFHTIRHLQGVTIVNFCIITEEQLEEV